MRLHERVELLTFLLFYTGDAWCLGDSVDYICGNTNIKPEIMEIALAPSQLDKHRHLLYHTNKDDTYTFYDKKMVVKVIIGDIAAICKNYYEAYQPKYGLLIRKID